MTKRQLNKVSEVFKLLQKVEHELLAEFTNPRKIRPDPALARTINMLRKGKEAMSPTFIKITGQFKFN